LLAVGLLFIYGTGQQTGGIFTNMWQRQVRWFLLGCGPMFFLAAVDYRRLGRFSWLIYGGALVLLVAVLLFGETRNNARSWLPVLPGMSLQPAELAKFGLLLVLAWLGGRPYTDFARWRFILAFLGLTAVPIVLIGLQPDLGSALVLAPIAVGIAFVSGLRWRHLLAGAATLLVLSPLAYRFVLAPHQRARLRTFLKPRANPTREGWNARQSLLAVGSGGVSGKGFMHGTQNVLGFLPRRVAPTDFIFSVIAEESGFVGASLLLGTFAVLLLLCLSIASRAPDPFGRNIACGIAILFATHIYINVGMTMGMAPIIGIPLPFVSYGGSFMLLMLSCIGLLQSIHIRRDTR
jgi:rod shape determining protein RodA